MEFDFLKKIRFSQNDTGGGDESREMKEKINGLLDYFRKFRNEEYGKLMDLLSGNTLHDPNNFKSLEDFANKIKDLENLAVEGGFSNLYAHDVGSAIRATTKSMSFVYSEMDKEDGFLVDMGRQAVQDNMAWSLCVLEDALLKMKNETKIEKQDQDGVKLNILRDALVGFGKSRSVEGLVKEKMNFTSSQLDNLLTADEQIEGCTGAVAGLAINSGRNAARESTEASMFKIEVKRESGELVIRILDNGKGIDQASLTPGNERCIFDKGVSHEGSSGLGLARALERMESMGAKLEVVSHRKDEEHVNHYPVESKLDLDKINEGRENPVNTVFEIRLKIVKK